MKQKYKYFLVVLVLIAPLLVVIFVLSPLLVHETTKDILSEYRLPQLIAFEQAREIVSRSQRDVAFGFYAVSLSKEGWNAAIEDVARSLVSNSTKVLLEEKIKLQKELVSSLGTIFLLTSIPQDFSRHSDSYPELITLMNNFLQEEFKLTMLGVCYKSTYDPEFFLAWDENLHRAAQKLKETIYILRMQ